MNKSTHIRKTTLVTKWQKMKVMCPTEAAIIKKYLSDVGVNINRFLKEVTFTKKMVIVGECCNECKTFEQSYRMARKRGYTRKRDEFERDAEKLKILNALENEN